MTNINQICLVIKLDARKLFQRPPRPGREQIFFSDMNADARSACGT